MLIGITCITCILCVAQPATASTLEAPLLNSAAVTPIFNSAIEAARSLGAQQSPARAAEISSKKTMGMVKIVAGAGVAFLGVTYMASAGYVAGFGGGRYAVVPLVVGGGLAAGGTWLVFSGVRDRADAAAMEAGVASLNFTPLQGGAALTFNRGW